MSAKFALTPETTTEAALTAMAAGQVTMQEYLAWDAAQKAALKAKPAAKLYCKVSEKGGLSVYGNGQWPTTLYVEQWQRLIDFLPQLQQFMADHASEFSKGKEDSAARAAAAAAAKAAAKAAADAAAAQQAAADQAHAAALDKRFAAAAVANAAARQEQVKF